MPEEQIKDEAIKQRKQTNKMAMDIFLTMDLHTLLLCPMLEASAFYYKTKCSVHTITIYHLNTQDTICNVLQGGALSVSEFPSCVTGFLAEL